MILHLKELMKAMGVTSITLADKVGVSKATVSYWLNGKVFPVPETLEKLPTLWVCRYGAFRLSGRCNMWL